MHFDSLNDIFSAFSKLKVLIIGDVMIDSYLWGRVNRISPEAPVPIVDVKEREKRLGGAANVALNVSSLDATPVLCSVIGDDEHGQQFLDLLKENNLNTEGIYQSKSRMTTVKHRIIAGSQRSKIPSLTRVRFGSHPSTAPRIMPRMYSVAASRPISYSVLLVASSETVPQVICLTGYHWEADA